VNPRSGNLGYAHGLIQELPITSPSNANAINPVVKSLKKQNFLLE